MKDFDTQNNWFLKILKIYFQNKEKLSLDIAKTSPFKGIIKFPDGSESQKISLVAGYIARQLKYHSDPMGGTFDYYTHPATIQYMIDENKLGQYGSDCDDYANYAYSILRLSGFAIDNVTVATLIPKMFPSIMDIRWCHVICVIDWMNKQPDINGWCWKATIDTNGLFWYPYKQGEDPTSQILKKFSDIYKTEYIYLIDHGYPFYEEEI